MDVSDAYHDEDVARHEREVIREFEDEVATASDAISTNYYEFVHKIMDPKARDYFRWLIRDLVLSHFDARELRIVEMYLTLIDTLTQHGEVYKDAVNYFIKEMLSYINSRRAKKGLTLRTLFTRRIEKSFGEDGVFGEEKKWWFK